MRIVYPLLWSRLDRKACREQSVNTAAALGRAGHEVTLLMPRRAGDPALDVGEVRAWFGVEGPLRLVQRETRWVGEGAVTSAMWLLQAFKDPEVRGADLLYSRIPMMIWAGWRSPVPFVTDHYRRWPDDWPILRRPIRKTARAEHSRGLILHSDYAAGSYRRAGVPAEKLLTAHNGANPAQMLPRLEAGEARDRLGLPRERRIAVYAGRVNQEKGLDQVLALAALRPEVLFLLVGSEGQGPIERAAVALDNVGVVPWQRPEALPSFLYAADVLLIPASSAPLERFGTCVLPMKTFAYLAAGRPILAPEAPDTAELLRDGDNALLVPPGRPAAAAAVLDRLLGDLGLARRLSEGALRTASELSWDHRATRISAFLQR